jgi:hypothetical protein
LVRLNIQPYPGEKNGWIKLKKWGHWWECECEFECEDILSILKLTLTLAFVPRTGLSQIIHIPLRGGKIRVSLRVSVRIFSSLHPNPHSRWPFVHFDGKSSDEIIADLKDIAKKH